MHSHCNSKQPMIRASAACAYVARTAHVSLPLLPRRLFRSRRCPCDCGGSSVCRQALAPNPATPAPTAAWLAVPMPCHIHTLTPSLVSLLCRPRAPFVRLVPPACLPATPAGITPCPFSLQLAAKHSSISCVALFRQSPLTASAIRLPCSLAPPPLAPVKSLLSTIGRAVISLVALHAPHPTP
jgi:hypothetical protein